VRTWSVTSLTLALLLFGSSVQAQRVDGSGVRVNGASREALADGTAAAPSLSFANQTDNGLYRTGSALLVASGGAPTVAFNYDGGGQVKTIATGSFTFSPNATSTSAADTILVRDGAANTLALKNGTNLQTFRVYDATGTTFSSLSGTSLATPTVNATTAYQVNGNTFSTATVGPASPVGTTSTTLVMAGLAGALTTRTGRIELCMGGYLTDNTANDGTKAQLSYGTGTAPLNGAVLTGTQVGPVQQYSAATLAAAASAPYGACWIVTGLSVGTAYWFDTAFAAITGGTASLGQASMIARDIP